MLPTFLRAKLPGLCCLEERSTFMVTQAREKGQEEMNENEKDLEKLLEEFGIMPLEENAKEILQELDKMPPEEIENLCNEWVRKLHQENYSAGVQRFACKLCHIAIKKKRYYQHLERNCSEMI